MCVCVCVCVCIPAEHFATVIMLLLLVVMFCTIDFVNNVCVLTLLCSPLETPGAESPVLTVRIQTQLVSSGPSQVPSDFVFPRNDSDGRSCHHQFFRKSLVSGEI